MPRPQKETRDKMYDTFSDFDLASQEIVLACLQELHRQAKRKANKELAETLYPSGTSESAVAKLPELHWGGPLIGDMDPRSEGVCELQPTAAGLLTDTDIDEKPVFKQKDV